MGKRSKPNKETMNYGARRAKAEVCSKSRRIQLDRIYERDHGICQICHKPCAREDASRDHLISPLELPFAEANSDANVQLAHKVCNNVRERTIRDSTYDHLTSRIGDLFPGLQQWASESD